MNHDLSVSLIYARSMNGVIGNCNQLPEWRIPGDLKRFRELTTGGIVVMGYKTWASLPEKSRPLKDRINVVITTRQGLVDDESEGVYFVNSIQEAKDKIGALLQKQQLEVWVVGGAKIYAEFAKYATRVYETIFMAYVDGDVEYTYSGFDRELIEETVVQGQYRDQQYNVHHRVWKTKPNPLPKQTVTAEKILDSLDYAINEIVDELEKITASTRILSTPAVAQPVSARIDITVNQLKD